MKQFTAVILVLLFSATFSLISAQETKKKECTHKHTVKCEKTMLCGHCGNVKGAEKCCAKDAVVCKKCGLHKGAAGCCKIAKGEDVELCKKCGEVKGDEGCCKADAKKCSKCGLHKGALGCCAIEHKG